jgi:cobaltochelatase CobN
MAAPWAGPRPALLAETVGDDPWRTAGDTVERIELLAAALIGGEAHLPMEGWARDAWPYWTESTRAPPRRSAPAAKPKSTGFWRRLAGRFVLPGPSGAPTRGRPDVLPTGRNFYSVDSRAVPTETAWELGWKSALLVERATRRTTANGRARSG